MGCCAGLSPFGFAFVDPMVGGPDWALTGGHQEAYCGPLTLVPGPRSCLSRAQNFRIIISVYTSMGVVIHNYE